MTALSDFQDRRRKQRVAMAKERIAQSKRHLSTRPQAIGNDVIRNLVEAAAGLLEELATTGDTTK